MPALENFVASLNAGIEAKWVVPPWTDTAKRCQHRKHDATRLSHLEGIFGRKFVHPGPHTYGMKRQDVSAEPSTVANQHEHVVNRCHPRAGVASSADSNFSLPPSRNTRSIRGRVRAVPLHTQIGNRKVRVVESFWVTCTNAASSTWSSSRTRVLSIRSPPPKQQSRTHREENAEATNFTAPASCCGETSTKISHGPTPSGSPEPQVLRGFCPVLHTKVSVCAIVGHRLQAALSDLLGPSPLFHAIGKRGARLLLCNFHTAATKKNTADRNKSGSHVAQLTISVQRFFCLKLKPQGFAGLYLPLCVAFVSEVIQKQSILRST